MSPSSQSILLIGATGRMASSIIHAASAVYPKLPVHAFARHPDKLSASDARLVSSVIRGDACSRGDVTSALLKIRPTHVLVAVGTSSVLRSTDVRTNSACVLISSLRVTKRLAFTRVAVVSALGASGSSARFGFGVGTAMKLALFRPLHDHSGQERVLKEGFGNDARARLLIVRATGLTEANERVRVNGVLELSERQRSPTLRVHRDDVAHWLIERMQDSDSLFGGVVALTGKPM